MNPPAVPPPSPEQQLAFLVKLQRLFSEGDFTATYKFALIIALADLALEHGHDDGRPLSLTIRQIAERFIELYWRHVLPYGSGQTETTPGILSQNLGGQAAVLSAIAHFQKATGATSLAWAKSMQEFEGVITQVAGTVSAQPLKYLQNFGGGTDLFLYERSMAGTVTLKPGVAYSLRRFYPLIQRLARAGWVEHVKGNHRNHRILGAADDLADFLFTTSRQSLLAIGQGLRKIEGDRCFYCGVKAAQSDVDHFLPFSLYPRDLAHNLVLSHPRCNRSKSDALAARMHLERWAARLDRHADDIAQVGRDAGIRSDVDVLNRVGLWAYQTAAATDSKAWVEPNVFEKVDWGYLAHFKNSPHPTHTDRVVPGVSE